MILFLKFSLTKLSYNFISFYFNTWVVYFLGFPGFLIIFFFLILCCRYSYLRWYSDIGYVGSCSLLKSIALSWRDLWELASKYSLLKSPDLNFNPIDKYGGVTLSADNREMFVCACKNTGTYFNCDIFTSKYEKV